MPTTLAINAMGTRFELVLMDGDTHRLRAVGELALREITDCHQRFNLFNPGSWLNTLNRRASHEAVPLDDLTFQLLNTCQQVHHDSNGAFDITVAPLMLALGLHNTNITSNHAQLQQARACVGMDHVILDRHEKTIRFTRPDVSLDLGAIAKGFAIDLAIEQLREHGVTCALLHGGTSTAAAIGSPPAQDAWRIQIHNSAAQPHEPAITARLNDTALSVSAPTGRTIESHNQAIHHIIDPRTAAPAACEIFAAAISPSATLADAWSTALLVLGHPPDTMPPNTQAILPKKPLPYSHPSTTTQGIPA
jgi:FAD:protein FMN transferase